VATYARTLGRAVATMGGEVDLVFGLSVRRGAPVEALETLFFEAMSNSNDQPAPPPRTLRARWNRLYVSPRPRQLQHIALHGRVIAPAVAERLPPFAGVHNFSGLWSVAARHFRRYGRFLPVRMQNPPHVMHWTYPVPIKLEGAANVYTVHDLVPLRLPHTSLEDKVYHERLLRCCVAEADRICTVSETSRGDLIDFVGADPARVVNCYQSIDAVDALDPDEVEARLRTLFVLEPQSYFLFYGAIEPKKNLGRLIEAFLTAEPDARLVIVGGRSWKAEAELALLGAAHGRMLPGAERIVMMEYLPRRLLEVLIQGARAVLFPSLYEGFGLPVLEAMARGVPVLISTAGALAEIAGDAAVAVDPYNVDAIATGLRRLDNDGALRRALSASGPAQAAKFGLDAYCERLSQLYRPLIRRAAPRALPLLMPAKA
ncbi:MAG: glycosyltransferase family 1 protein, partial [Pseudorhodoplanes sp.]